MLTIPLAARPLLQEFSCAFTRPTFQRWLLVRLAALLTTGRQPLLTLRRTVGSLAPGPPSSSHRVFSQRRWSTGKLARILSRCLLARWVPQGSVALAGDDPVEAHPGRKVCGNARQREPVRATHTCTA